MSVLFIVIPALVILGVMLFAARKIAVTGAVTCTVDQIPAVFDRLQRDGKEGSFAVFLPKPPDPSKPDDTLNIQFSIERGRPGLDWCLLAPTNLRDREKFERLAVGWGYSPRLQTMNGVEYLRIEDGDLPRLCTRVVREIYGQGANAALDLVVEGFSWP